MHLDGRTCKAPMITQKYDLDLFQSLLNTGSFYTLYIILCIQLLFASIEAERPSQQF